MADRDARSSGETRRELSVRPDDCVSPFAQAPLGICQVIAMTRERKSLASCPPETRRRYGEQVV